MTIARRARNTFHLMKRAASKWSDDNAPTFAASLSYYTIFSIAPVLVIAVSVAGMVFGEEAARGQMQAQLRDLVGQSGADIIGQMMISARKPSAGIFATALGVIALAFGATGVFVQLQDALNHIWDVKPNKERGGVINFLRTRLVSFAMVLVIGFLLLVSLVVSAVLAALGAWFDHLLPGWTVMWQGVNLLVSFGVITVLFAMMYKILPDTHVAWKDVWLGAAVTSLLFGLGKFGIGLYLGRSAVASSYGAAGSLAVVLLWVYYSAQILFLGAEFTQVYARRHGSRAHETPVAA
ncbi:YihY/virulence factor BrkB family protein [Melittangium boletus]|uniref:Ribonuclease BN n=1 Tax=Melittangium boletus DSM 14713 TaxID=1294270 RepID=A0A286SGD1_9BACT|nr:YihY/virulence factor BrkB family protein [Melittangium boletus]ATB26607.1 ribonuclease BN [Melittangium boletus DSM 14713]